MGPTPAVKVIFGGIIIIAVNKQRASNSADTRLASAHTHALVQFPVPVVEFGCTGEPRRWGLILFGMEPGSPLDGFAVTFFIMARFLRHFHVFRR